MNWKRKISAIGILIFSLLLMACGQTMRSDKNNKKIAVVCSSAGQNDNGYNQSAVKGAEKIAKELGLDYKVVEPTTGVPKALETLAEDGYQIIFSLEYDFEALIQGTGGAKAIAEQYPDTLFVVMNDNPNRDESGNPIHKNVISVLFDVHEASFVAGALSTLVIENHKELFDSNLYNFHALDNGGRSIGFIGGTNSNGITVFSYGFLEGISYVAEKLGVTYDYYAKYDAGFTDSATGSMIAGTYYNQGANIVFAVAGSVGDGVASKAKEMQKLAIQVDANKDSMQPGYILTSVIKNTEVPVYNITKEFFDGKAETMERVQTYSLASGATSITDLSEIEKYILPSGQQKWRQIKKELEEIIQNIENGNIPITNAQNGEELSTERMKNITIQ